MDVFDNGVLLDGTAFIPFTSDVVLDHGPTRVVLEITENSENTRYHTDCLYLTAELERIAKVLYEEVVEFSDSWEYLTAQSKSEWARKALKIRGAFRA